MQITNQIAYVQKKYREITQEAANIYSIIFQDDESHASFKVSIPPNFPQSPPSVTKNGKNIMLPILENWIPQFQLINLFEQMHLLIKIPAPPIITFNESEIENYIKSVPPDQLKTNEGKLAAISPAQTIKNAQKYSERANKSLSQVEPRLKDQQAKASSSADTLNTLINQKIQYDQMKMNPNQTIFIPPDYIENLKNSQRLAKQRANEILEQFHNHQITFHDFVRLYYEEKKNEYYFQSVIEQVQFNY